MRKLLSTAFVLAIGAAGCTHSLHQDHVSDFGQGVNFAKDKKIETQTEQFVVLGFVGQTNYLDQAYEQLQSQCPKGEILGITTESWTSHGFLSWTNKIRMQGYCQLN
jgi:hypothetical protein